MEEPGILLEIEISRRKVDFGVTPYELLMSCVIFSVFVVFFTSLA